MKFEDLQLSGSLDISGSMVLPLHAEDSDISNPIIGDLYFNTVSQSVKVYNGTGGGWQVLANQTGGVNMPLADIEYLVVGGGGAGGGQLGGGGGAGGFVASTLSSIESGSSFTITVGAGGTGGTGTGPNGGDSSISGTEITTVTALGGGGGSGGATTNAGQDGGSGGGGSRYNGGGNGTFPGGSGTAGQGFDGGVGVHTTSPNENGGGGGGAGAAGSDATSNAKGSYGEGGEGKLATIDGYWYAGGGGGGDHTTSYILDPGDGGKGGGAGGGSTTAGYYGLGDSSNTARNNGDNGVGSGNTGQAVGGNGGANTGGGGGGAGWNTSPGGSGGSGAVVLAYPTSSVNGAGGIVSGSNGKNIHFFNSSGNFVVGGTSDFTVDTTSLQFYYDAGDFASRGTSTVTDTQGNYNGTVSGASLGNNFYYTFDGSNDKISNSFTRPASAQTFMFWVRYLGDGANGYNLSGFQEVTSYFYIGRINSTNDVYYYAGNGNASGTISSSTIANNVWVLQTLTMDASGNTTVYTNTTSIHTGADGVGSAGTHTFQMGAINSTSPGYFINADVGIVAYYTKHFSSSDVTDFYNATKTNFV